MTEQELPTMNDAFNSASKMIDKITITKRNIFNITKSINDIKEQMCIISNKLQLEISMEVGADGKNVYSNQMKRDSELALRLEVHTEYNEKKQLVTNYTNTIKELEIALSTFEQTLSLHKKVMDYQSNGNVAIVTELEKIGNIIGRGQKI